MNRATMAKLLSGPIRKGIENGFEAERIIDACLNRIEVAMELEAEEAGAGMVADFPRAQEQWAPPTPPPAPEKPSGLPAFSQESVILRPDSPEAKTLMKTPTAAAPIRIRPQRAQAESIGSGANRRYWKMMHGQGKDIDHLPLLSEYLEFNMPAEIGIEAEGRERPVILKRAMDALLPIDQIKVSYHLGSENTPTPSSPNSNNGEVIGPMAIDCPVFYNFSCFDRDQPIEKAMDAIYRSAAIAYRPRPQELASATPRRAGVLTDRMAADHLETDKLRNHRGEEF